MTQRPGKKAEEISHWDYVFPNDTNPYGTLFGGKLLSTMDTTAAICAHRFCDTPVATAAVEAVEFTLPFFVGDRVKTVAKVVYVGQSSMMIKVSVFNANEPDNEKLCTSAIFTLVALDENRKPMIVPDLIIETDEEKADAKHAAVIRESVLKRKKESL